MFFPSNRHSKSFNVRFVGTFQAGCVLALGIFGVPRGEALGFFNPEMGDNNWTTIRTKSTSWSNQGLRYYKGECWYRTTVKVPEKYRGRKLRLWLGGIDDKAKAWINGIALTELQSGAAPIGKPWTQRTCACG